MYKHLPAGGIGESDPFRPRATGGIGYSIFIVFISNIEAGTIELRWYQGDPSTGWAVFLGSLIWDEGEVSKPWATDLLDTQPWAEGEKESWSIWVGNELWTFSSATIGWDAHEIGAKWQLFEAESNWKVSDTSFNWSMGEVF